MSPDAFDKPALIQHRLKLSRDTLRDAKMLFEQDGTPGSIVNRAYYAMFYAALALLVTIDRESSKHSGVIAIFDEEFIKQKILPKEMSKALHEAFETRLDGDYRQVTVIDKEKAAEIIKTAERFIKAIEEKLKK